MSGISNAALSASHTHSKNAGAFIRVDGPNAKSLLIMVEH